MLESRAEPADDAIRELKRQIHSHRMEIFHRNLEYEASRREQVWLSLQNYETVRELNKMIVLELFKKWRNLKTFAVPKLRELKGYDRMIFLETN